MSSPRGSGHPGTYAEPQEYTRVRGYGQQPLQQEPSWHGEQGHQHRAQQTVREPVHHAAHYWQYNQSYGSPGQGYTQYVQHDGQQGHALQHEYPVPGTTSSVSSRKGSFEQDVAYGAQDGPGPRPMFEGMVVRNIDPRQRTAQFVRGLQNVYAARAYPPLYDNTRMRSVERIIEDVSYSLSNNDRDNTNDLFVARSRDRPEQDGHAANHRHRHSRHGRRSCRGCRARRERG